MGGSSPTPSGFACTISSVAVRDAKTHVGDVEVVQMISPPRIAH